MVLGRAVQTKSLGLFVSVEYLVEVKGVEASLFFSEKMVAISGGFFLWGDGGVEAFGLVEGSVFGEFLKADGSVDVGDFFESAFIEEVKGLGCGLFELLKFFIGFTLDVEFLFEEFGSGGELEEVGFGLVVFHGN